MNKRYKSNFNGYFPVLRAILVLIKERRINLTQLGALIVFVAEADWDNKHETYGCIIRDDKTLAQELNLNQTTFFKNRKKLIEKGLLAEDEGLTRVTNLKIFELEWVKVYAKFPIEVLQDLFAKSHEEVEKEHDLIAKRQKIQDQKGIQSFKISSKGKLGLSKEDVEDIDYLVEELNNDDIE